MEYEFSEFGQRIASRSGIEDLMQDLGEALRSGQGIKMLGGGQPAKIEEMNAVWRERMAEILGESDQFERAVANYDPPRGNPSFREAVATLLREQFGWKVGPENIAITSGGQTAFFFLFNALAGKFSDGRCKEILLPFVPEYIGYSNQGLAEGVFRAAKPKIERLGEHGFKYRVDFENLEIRENTAAICVSRPTNPTGNVITDEEVTRLSAMAKEAGIPLIIDGAYGAPFPNIFFADAKPYWDEHVILTLSLSKIGLPGTRTGIVVAPPEIAAAMASATAVCGLANSNLGQMIVEPLLRNGELLRLSNEVVQPYYLERSRLAQAWVKEFFDPALPYRVHVSEGALFLWLWFEGLPITTKELYERLKARGVLVVPSEYFFFGVDDSSWQHPHECVRMTFTMDEATVRGGIAILAEEVAKAYRGN